MSNRKSLWVAAAATAVLSLNVTLIPPSTGEVPVDFRSFYLSARGFFGEGNIYDIGYLHEIAQSSGLKGRVNPYLYPPVLAFYLWPLGRLDPGNASRWWWLLTLFACAAIAAQGIRWASIAIKGKGGAPPLTLYLAAFALFFVLPFGNNLVMGQVNAIVLLFIVLALVQSFGRGRDVLAGALLGAAALIKTTPAVLLLFFLLNGRPKVFHGFMGGCALIALPTLLAPAGVEAWGRFFEFLPALSHGKTIPGLFPAESLPNFSAAGFFARLFENGDTVRFSACAFLFFLLAALVFQHRKIFSGTGAPLSFLPYSVFMVIASPLAFLHHVIYLYPGLLAVAWHWLSAKQKGGWVRLGLMGAATAVAGIDFPLRYEALGISAGPLLSLNFYALLFLFLVGLWAPFPPTPQPKKE